MAITIHFDKDPPEALEQALGTEARYVIQAYSKIPGLQRIFPETAAQIVAECMKVGESVVDALAMVLTDDLKKLYATTVYLKNGEHFTVLEKYALLEDRDSQNALNTLLGEPSPRVFRVTYK
jgi:hypothetical protein